MDAGPISAPPPMRIAYPPALTPVVVASPHSGMHYPAAFLETARLDLAMLRRSEDCFVDSLLADAPACGAPLIAATFPRVFCDVNRAKWELDPAMFDGRLPVDAITDSPKLRAGFGMMARRAGPGRDIYRKPLPVAEAAYRQTMFWQPYHDALRSLIDRALDRFGRCLLLDGHSMPKSPFRNAPDIVLGDAHGTACDPRLVAIVENALRARNYTVARNNPYAGGYVTRHYGRPHFGVHVLQIEISRSLYMDEETLLPLSSFERVRHDLTSVMAEVVDAAEAMHALGLGRSAGRSIPGAA
ncbi:N-formylglutamate amidohydrolase [Tanticharoenia sakaeratensis]|uniref:N-formylglutamate amidohydrolase n=1 Tax=Tanticharoenia sakaeratensis NBRC 103193 TaxID=1231623 RepID=A0A0D6MIS6_9PROT|nr:N-formylglutamate amidohydrolase [Tanticharoenia sakaeratensis]GAN53386.1 N-formylglutamate amidohydrolase [Tanticharoenia sakaeratensis NBRC 103193]GBQ20794.1 N-formylglutamate amidohydrolase [Tanticharoenia sakaeratensis NBRC 103193]